MFKKAKRRIVLTILSILCAVLVATLGLVYFASYMSVTNQNYQILEQRAEAIVEAYGQAGDEGNEGRENADAATSQAGAADNAGKGTVSKAIDTSKGQKKYQRNQQVGTFYSVRLAADNTAMVLENGAEEVYTSDELITFAESVRSKTRGTCGDLLYLVTESNGNTFVCFMDNATFTDSFSKLFGFTLLFGVIAIIVITFISIKIAGRIVQPMEETYQKQKQFTADAGHELKTPIAAVAANIELLQREIGANKWLDNISYENERMRGLVTELLDLARNENKAVDLKPTDLSHLVTGAILPMEANAFERNILIESDVAEGITANVDEKGISQLATILVDNAISHASCPGGSIGTVSVRLAAGKGAAVLSVANPGEPIPENERAMLFERFYRTDSSHEFTGHYGLGLAIAKAIAEANGAKISVDCKDGLVIFSVDFSA